MCGPVWLTPAWPAPARVRAAFTTRVGGFSKAPYDGLNLALHVGDREADVRRNRASLREALDLPTEPAWLDQYHGCEVADLDHPPADPRVAPRADAAVTRRAGRVCAVLVADCVPVLLCTRLGHRVAAVHAGWRGLARGVLRTALAALDTPPAGLLAWVGPAIGPRAYVVGAALRGRFVAAEASNAAAFSRRDEHWHMDLPGLVAHQLEAAGVSSVSRANLCVHDEPERFYSYRRDGVTGRMAALIWLMPGDGRA